jgi:hypothetical protein
MRDLYTIFRDLETDPRSFRYPKSEDTGLPFDKVLEIAEQEDDAAYDDDE